MFVIKFFFDSANVTVEEAILRSKKKNSRGDNLKMDGDKKIPAINEEPSKQSQKSVFPSKDSKNSVLAPIESVEDEKDDNSEESDEEDDDKLCIICMDNPRTHVILPCFHFISCRECVGGLTNLCPVCRLPIEGAREIYTT